MAISQQGIIPYRPMLSAEPIEPWSSDRSGSVAGPQLSVIIPTRNEAGNIAPLLSSLGDALAAVSAELIFVDDSDDDTATIVQTLAEESRKEVVLLHRPEGQRDGGLGGAVAEGLRRARSPWVCVMDADLQHPPALIPALLKEAEQQEVDLVMASRLSAHASATSLGPLRRRASRSLIMVARLAFPSRLRNVSDPLTGFFLLRKDAIVIDELRPNGFKILLEILVRFPTLRLAEVPFTFGTRFSGESKASASELVRYFSLLTQLRFGGSTERFMRFALVGASGLVVNLLLHAIFTDLVGIYYLTGAVLATQGSSLWNFGLTELWVFDARRRPQGRRGRLVQFLLMNNAALLLRGPIMYVLTSLFGMHYLLSNLISMIVLTIVRFALSDRWIWGDESAPRDEVTTEDIHIHNLRGNADV